MYNLNFNQLYYFYVVATFGSIKKACDILHLTQPSISGGIKNLEDTLGLQLFDREYRKLSLNENGKKIYKKTQQIFLLGEELLIDIQSTKKNDKKFLQIGMSNDIPTSISIDLIEEFWKRNIEVNVEYESHHDLLSKFNSNKLDIIFTNKNSQDTQNATIKKVLNSKYYIYANKLSHKSNIAINSIPCITFGKLTHSGSMNIIGTINNSEAFIETAKRGNSLSIIDEYSSKKLMNANEFTNLGILEQAELNIFGHSQANSKQSILINDILTTFSAQNMNL